MNFFFQMPIEHSPRDTIARAIKQTSTHLKELEPYSVCSLTIMESITERQYENLEQVEIKQLISK